MSNPPMLQELRLSLRLGSAPAAVRQMLLDAALVSAATGRPAEVEPVPGGRFRILGGRIDGHVTRLADDQVAVHVALGLPGWPAGVHTPVTITLAPETGGTRVMLQQTGIPAPHAAGCDHVWKEEVFGAMRRTLEPRLKTRRWSLRGLPAEPL